MKKLTKIKKLQDPGLSEFVYTVATIVPLSAKRHLPEKFYKKTRTESQCRKFARTATDAQKLEYLSYLGYRSITLLSNHDTIWNPELQKVLKKYEDEKKSTILAEILNETIYLVSDKKLFNMLSGHADFIDTPLYKMHMEMIRSAKGAVGWEKKLENNDVVSKKEEALMSYLKVLYSGIEDILMCDRYIEISPIEFKALLFMFLHKNKYVTYEAVQTELHGLAPIKETRPILRELLQGLYIQQHFDIRKQEYTITSKGIKAVMDFCERSIIKLNQAA